MALSGAMYARYTSETDIDWRHAFVLLHPTAGTLRIIDHTEEFLGYDNGVLQTYQGVPTKITLPTRNESGRSDLSLAWCGIHNEALKFLNDAYSDATQPIRCWHTIYILTDSYPQLVPFIEYRLTNIAVTEEAVTAVAASSDIINPTFPRTVYRVDQFPGLRRR